MQSDEHTGLIPSAIYGDPGLPEYRGNPFISALPPVSRVEDVVAQLRVVPHFDRQEAFLDGRLRAHAIARLLYSFFQPLNHHLELEHKLAILIRQGYLGRNPVGGSYYAHLQNGFRRVEEEDLDAKLFDSAVSTANSLSLFGCSGCGKTRTLERILAMYPQAIHHKELNVVQLPYLKLDCPIDGDLDELCLSFFNRIDNVLKTSYSKSHGRKKLGTKRLMTAMCQVANLHALGVLIIDEVQNLNEAKSGGAAKMHNFFVSLVNTIGVPVVQVGTHRASRFFQQTFRAARRVTGMGSMCWDRLPRDGHWNGLLKKLWQYQWLKDAAPLDDALEAEMYDKTQGVMDIVIKLFALAQIRAIATGVERLSPPLLLKVYEDEFKPVHPMMEALKTNRPDIIAKYDDLLMPQIEGKLLALSGSLGRAVPEPSRASVSGDNKAKGLLAFAEQIGIPSDIAVPMVENLLGEYPDLPLITLVHKLTAYMSQDRPAPSRTTRVKGTEWSNFPPDDLRAIFAAGPPENAYDRFKAAGLIFDLAQVLEDAV